MRTFARTEATASSSRVAAVAPGRSDLLQRKCACGGAAGVDGACAGCREKRLTVPSIVHDVLSSPGQPLDSATRASMEQRFGHDFSHVRVHTDDRAAESARELPAAAFTSGSNIVFASRAYAPQTPRGRQLIAHELTHVLQRGQNSESRAGTVLSLATDPAERQADAIVEQFALGRPLGTWIPAAPSSLLSLAPELWYRGEGVGVPPAPDYQSGERGFVHDLGEGTYFTDQLDVAEEYAEGRSPNLATRRVLAGQIDPHGEGRVLNLTQEPDFMKVFNQVKKTLGKVSGEPYREMFDNFLRVKGLKDTDFDIIIGPEGVRGGRQMCVRNPKVAASLRAKMTPIKIGGGSGPGRAGGGAPPDVPGAGAAQPPEGTGAKALAKGPPTTHGGAGDVESPPGSVKPQQRALERGPLLNPVRPRGKLLCPAVGRHRPRRRLSDSCPRWAPLCLHRRASLPGRWQRR